MMYSKFVIPILLFHFCNPVSAQKRVIVFENAEVLPEVQINGESVKIHTQGLWVTDEHYLVTGRLETKPKRALLLRFSRSDRKNYETVDISPAPIQGAILDHPGGFDADSKGQFWIPLSTSNPKGPSVICQYQIEPNQPLPSRPIFTFPVDDHIGAICRHRDDSLVGANWDTKTVYAWSPQGELITSTRQDKVFGRHANWQVAVQDWKFFQPHDRPLIVLGGIDKSKKEARATIQIVDFFNGEILESHHFSTQEGVTRPITNEGLALHKGKLYLLPEDIGRGAKVLRYRFDNKTADKPAKN